MRLSLTLTLFPLTIWCSGTTVLFLFKGKGGSGVLGNCSLCGTEATLSFSAGPVCSSFSAEACVILHTLCYWCPLQSLVFSLLLSLVSTFLGLEAYCLIEIDTQVPSISTEKLVLPRHARCVLSCLRCNGHSVLLSS